MPIYEFYCPDCHRIFNFMARRMNTRKRPDCPRCGHPKLERQVSLFAFSKNRSEEPDGPDEHMPDIDEARLERAMESLAKDAEHLDEENPRQMAGLMRKLYDATGMKLGEGMDEAIRRMEAGEDPDQIEAELGDVLEAEDPFSGEGDEGTGKPGRLKQWKKILPPTRDEKLYDL